MNFKSRNAYLPDLGMVIGNSGGPLTEGLPMRRRAVIATALVSLSALAVTAAVAAGPVMPVAGTVTWCLSSAAAQHLTADGVVVSAGAPAALDSSGPTPCVQWPMKGKISLDLTEGSWTAGGGMTFTRASDGRSLRFTGAHGDLARRSMSVDAAVGNEASKPVDLSTYELDMTKMTVTMPSLHSPGSVEGKPFDTMLVQDGAAVFSQAFGAPPVPSGNSLATLAGRVEVVPALG
ncbi:hypothetical protein ABZ656_32455 [Streptomyces sp. NPDC007095]|uniref:hypothetical protein n=1 Tax=Streptomyces sp. NPDC007095 TaxID=3154482 RepID=UPI00340B008A